MNWAEGVFAFVPRGRERRRPSDAFRIAFALVGVLATAAVASRTGHFEGTIVELLQQLPGTGRGLFRTLVGVLAVFCAAITILALVARRLRLAATLLIAGVAAALGSLAARPLFGIEDARSQADFVTSTGDVSEFPCLILAVLAAVLLAALPYLTRPARRFGVTLAPLAALGVIYIGAAIPSDAVGALFVAWGCAAIAHLVVGSPAGTPSEGAVGRTVSAVSVEAHDIQLADEQPWGAARFTASDADDTPLDIVVLGRDATDARLVATAWRFLWYKDSGASLALSRHQRVEHEAYLLLLAQRTGVAVPEVVAAGVAGPRSDAVLVTRPPAGAPLSELPPDQLTDEVLTAAWGELAHLHEARLAHGDVRLHNLVATPDGSVGFLDFSRGSTVIDPQAQRLDELGLLAATADVVGAERAVAAYRAARGDDDLVGLVPLLQPSALAVATRKRPPKPKELLGALRDEALRTTGAEPPELAELRRVSPTDLVMAVATVVGVYLLAEQLSGVDDLWATLTSADPAWVVAVIIFSQLPQVTSAITVTGAVDAPLPFGRVVALQFANGFTGLVGGTVANTALVIRFFQKHGLSPSVAVSSGVLWSIAGFIVQVVLVVVCFFIATPDLSDINLGSDGGSSGDGPSWMLYLLIVGVILGVAFAIPRIRHRVLDKVKPQAALVWENLRGVASKPRKAVQLFGGALGTQVFFALSLQSAVHAYGGTVSFSATVLTNSFASMVGGLAPIPGGMGVTEAGMIAGLTAAGVPQETAVAATLLHRTFTYYLPPTWGWVALNWLRRHDDV